MQEYKLDIKKFFSQKDHNDSDIYIVAALDILGFSNFVISNYDLRGKKASLHFVLRYLMNIVSRSGPCRAAFFSDCLFIFLKVNFEKTMYNNFSTMLHYLEKIITEGMSEGFLIRGGVCVGECTIEDNIFYGPGIIKAHVLEEKEAKNARIIMDSFDYEQLVSLFNYASPNSLNEMTFIKDDEYYAFDYIEAMFRFTGMHTDMYECLRRYKGWIQGCRDQIKEDSSEENIEKNLSKLSYHINSYYRIIGEYPPDAVPDNIKSLD